MCLFSPICSSSYLVLFLVQMSYWAKKGVVFQWFVGNGEVKNASNMIEIAVERRKLELGERAGLPQDQVII